MQPNQQNQSPQQDNNYASSSGVPIPGYLGMDPPAESSLGHRSKLPRIIAVLAGILLTGALLVATFVWLQGTSERKFYDALQNSMNTSYIARKYETKVNEKTTSLIESQSDFSDSSKLRSNVSYEATGSNARVRGEIISLNSTDYATRISELSGSGVNKGVVLDKWYEVRANGSTTNPVVTGVNPNRTINTSYGTIIIGKLSDNTRMQLLDFARTSGAYKIVKTYSEAVNNKSATAYVVDINSQTIGLLNKRYSELSNTKLAFPYDRMAINKPVTSTMTIWVDDESSYIIRTNTESADTKSKTTRTDTVSYSYPSSVTIRTVSDME